MQRIKREEYSTLKACNLLFLCVGSTSYCYIHLSNLAFLLGAETYNRLFFSIDDFGSVVLYCLLIVVGSFWKRAASPRSVFKYSVHKPYLIRKIQNKTKLNSNLIRGKPDMVNTTGVRCVLSQMMLSDTAYPNPTLKFLN